MLQPNYIFSPSILKSYSDYLNCDKTWEKYYGWSDEPSVTLEDYQERVFKELIDAINKVEQEPNEACDRGTVFNEIIDCVIHKRVSDTIEIRSIYNEEQTSKIGIEGKLNGFTFVFPIDLVNYFANLYSDETLSQYHTEAILHTNLGNVMLHGFVDEINPLSVHDIKTTTSYEPFKYEKNWQHKVYIYCLRAQGSQTDTFFYDICEFSKNKDGVNLNKYEIHHEQYIYEEERDERDLRAICEDFIGFLEAHKGIITNEKIFGKL